MKKNDIIKSIVFAVAILCIWSCESGVKPLNNGVYLTEAQVNYNKKVVVDDQGGSTNLSLRLAMKADNSVIVNVDSKQTTLDAYNNKYGTTLVMLPEHLYSLNKKTFTVDEGKIGATELLSINILPFDETIDISNTYAIPISIESANGIDILEPAKSIMLILDQVIITNIYIGNASKTHSITCPTLTATNPIANVTTTTTEFLINVDAFPSLLKHVLSIVEAGGKNIFSRFGNAGRTPNEIQVNSCDLVLYSPSLFAAKKWYHLAIVNTGSDVIFYIDGVQDMKVGHALSGSVFNYTSMTLFFHNKSSFSEFRFWSKARTQSEILNNMYKINPKTEGLEVYWKINEGSGKIVKDHTDKGRDGLINGTGNWKSGQRFPSDT